MYPASTAARDAPTAAFNLSAMAFINLKFSPLCRPLPPEITTRAVPSSGLSDLVSSLLINFETLGMSIGSTFSIEDDPPEVGAGSKEVGLIVIHFFCHYFLQLQKHFQHKLDE